MVQAISVLLNLAIAFLIVVSISRWLQLIVQRRHLIGHGLLDSIVTPRERSRPFWTPADALLMFGAMILISQGLMIAMVRNGLIERATTGDQTAELTAMGQIGLITASSVGGLAAAAITLAWLRIFSPNPLRQLGLTVSMNDIKLGLKGALMILPPVMLVSAAASYFVPYEHPVLESLSKLGSPAVFIATLLGTAIVTPVIEELLLRGLLQGSLQGIADHDGSSDGPRLTQMFTPELTTNVVSWRPRSYWPMVVASLVFACLHIPGQGAAPIPLFVLSLGLGYLYRQTGSLTPSIVVHMVLNGLTLVVELLKLNST